MAEIQRNKLILGLQNSWGNFVTSKIRDLHFINYAEIGDKSLVPCNVRIGSEVFIKVKLLMSFIYSKRVN